MCSLIVKYMKNNQQSLNKTMKFFQLESRPIDVEFVKLLHEVHSEEIPGHIYRGFSVLTNTERKIRDIQVKSKSIKFFVKDFKKHLLPMFITFTVFPWREKEDLVYLLWNGISMARNGQIIAQNPSIRSCDRKVPQCISSKRCRPDEDLNR